jgi:hypothetical protein
MKRQTAFQVVLASATVLVLTSLSAATGQAAATPSLFRPVVMTQSGEDDVESLPARSSTSGRNNMHAFLRIGGNSPSRATPSIATIEPKAALAATTGTTEEVLTSFPAVTLDRQLTLGVDQFVTPPDNGLAVGPNHVVEMVNSSGTIWNKSGGDPIKIFDLNTFFLVPSGYAFSDPRVLYDQLSGRWFASGVAFVTPSFGSLIVIAVSTTSDPTGTWVQYSTDNSSNVTHDQPKFGVSDDKFVISWNDFLSAQFFQGESTWIFEKSQMVAGSMSVNGAAIGPDSTRAALVPAVQLSAGSPEYIAYNNSDCATLGCNKGSPTFGLAWITGTPLGGNLVWNEADPAIAATSQPPNADQPGLPASIATNDDRFLTAIWQNGILWTGGNDACLPGGDTATRPCSRLIQVLTSGSTINQSFDIGSTGNGLYYPAFAMDGGGSMYVVYNVSSSTQNVGVRITGQPASAPIQTVAAAQTIKAGETTYDMNPCFGTTGPSRWGDYSGAAIDPQNPTDVWVASEYAAIGTTASPSDAGCAWGTFAGRLTFSAPAVASVSPASGAASTVVTVSGTDFAPGATVNFGSNPATNVVVTSPNQLNATAPAACGTVDVIVNTPDGASAPSPADQFTYATGCGGGDFTISASPTTVSIQQGASGTSTISTTIVGSAGMVSLSASISPPGPTASLSPAAVSAGSSSTLTVNVGASVATGPYTVTVTGSEGTNTHSTTVAVTVTALPPPADFTISASPTSVSIQQGSSGNSTISTTIVGSAGTVSLSAGVSPSGPTASLSPAAVSAGGSSTLTVSVGPSVPTGSYTVTVTGNEGSNTHSTTVAVTVTAPPPPPDFTISATPSSRTVNRGSGTTYAISITRTTGFTGAVTFSVGGLPSRTSSSFNPNNTTGSSSTMSVSTRSRTPRGTFVLTITAVSGSLRHTTTVTLVVH